MREHVDLPTVDAMEEEWRQHPPVHYLVAAYLGYSAKERAAPAAAEDHLEELMTDLGNLPVQRGAAIDTSAFDEAMKATRGSDHG